MKKGAKKEPEMTRIIAIDGSDILKHGITTRKNGKLYPDAFRGVLDESLDTLKMKGIFKRHKGELPFPYLENKQFCRAVVNVSFAYAIKQFEQYGRKFVRHGCTVTDDEMTDHVCVRDGELIAIEVPYQKDTQYASVQNPISEALLGKYFVYDSEAKAYRRSKAVIPSAVTCKAIREKLYTKGFDIDGVHYVRYKRSAGASRDGRCMFIAEPLYADMMKWSACGLSADDVTDQASWQAYLSLTMSSIEGTIRLPKKAIFIMPDAVSTFETDAVSVEETADHDLKATEKKVTVRNKIWDGQAMLDISVFEENGYADYGMVLLRNRFFKTCAFNTRLQEWFADNGIASVSQLAGYTTARDVKDIKLVITESSLKYLKFMPPKTSYKKGFKRWLDAAYEGKDESVFGVVKTDKPAPLMNGSMAYTNYQLINTLGLSYAGIEEKVLADSFDYLDNMLADSAFLRYHIHTPEAVAKMQEEEIPDLETYRMETVLDMTCRTPYFENTDFYKSFRRETVSHFKDQLKDGRIPVGGGYMTMFGNPCEFLYALIGWWREGDESVTFGAEEIFTTAFPLDQIVLCSRSPHITMGNLYLARNMGNVEITAYFNLTPNIVCVNSIDSNLLHRLNGSDFDSDTLLVTDEEWLVRGSAQCYQPLKVPVCMVEPAGKAEYAGTPSGLAKLDYDIAENKIGEIVNLSQFLNCLFWDLLFTGKTDYEPLSLYYDICKLAVLSGMEIDKAKRMYAVDTGKVLRKLGEYRRKYKESSGGHLPEFFLSMTGGNDGGTGENKARLNCPMSFVYEAVNAYRGKAKSVKTIPLSELFSLDNGDCGANDTHKKQNIIKAVTEAFSQITALQTVASKCEEDEKVIYRNEAQEIYLKCLEKVSKNVVNDHILAMLLSEIDHPDDSRYEIKSCRYFLFSCLLYEENRRLLSKVKTPEDYVPYDLIRVEPELVPEGYRTEMIYGFPHAHLLIQ